jgi:hypothetical protein
MPWRIPSARCPRCAREVRTVDLAAIPVEWLLAEENAAVLWPRGGPTLPPVSRPAPTVGRNCTGCTRISVGGREKCTYANN